MDIRSVNHFMNLFGVKRISKPNRINDDKNFSVSKVCRLCHKEHKIKMNYNHFMDWKNGMFIQNALPYLNEDERKLLISGVCRECFDNIGEEHESGL